MLAGRRRTLFVTNDLFVKVLVDTRHQSSPLAIYIGDFVETPIRIMELQLSPSLVQVNPDCALL